MCESEFFKSYPQRGDMIHAHVDTLRNYSRKVTFWELHALRWISSRRSAPELTEEKRTDILETNCFFCFS